MSTVSPRPCSNKGLSLAATGFWLCLAGSALGLGTRIPDQNAEATARGDAFAATADNPSAVYYNPAGITQLSGTELLLGGYGVTATSRASLTGRKDLFYNQNEPQAVPQIFVTTKLPNVPISLGLGVYVPFGFSIHYPDSVPFRTIAKTGSLEFLAINPVVSDSDHQNAFLRLRAEHQLWPGNPFPRGL